MRSRWRRSSFAAATTSSSTSTSRAPPANAPLAEHRIQLPLTDDTIAQLRAGDYVYLSGEVLTARDAAHKRMVETLARDGALPADLRGQVIYYTGPTPARPGETIGSAGPTTAERMDGYTIPLLQAGLKGAIG